MSQPYASCRLQFEAPYSLLPQHLQGRAGTGTVPAVETPTLELDPDVLGMGREAAWAGDTAMNTEEEDVTMRSETNKATYPYIVEEHPTGSWTFGRGSTLMDQFRNDEFAHLRQELPYYPFASRDEWELASFLLRSDLSMSVLDEFFKLSLVMLQFLSYRIYLIQFADSASLSVVQVSKRFM